MKFQPGDVVKFRGMQDEFKVETVFRGGDVMIRHKYYSLTVKPETIELVRRKGPVVFECEWEMIPVYTEFGAGKRAVPARSHLECVQFVGKKTRVTIEVIEEEA